jgi:hypothetical protein
MLNPIEALRDKYKGNYDALLGKISNFNWTFNPDGSYSIELTIISLGDVIESLKSNLAINKITQDFFNKLYPKKNTEGTEDEEVIDEEETFTDDITSMLAIYKYINKDISNPKRIYINTPDKKTHSIAYKLSTEQEDSTTGKVSATTITFQWKAIITGRYSILSDIETNYTSKDPKYQTLSSQQKNFTTDNYSYEEFSPEFVINSDEEDLSDKALEERKKFEDIINEKYKEISEKEKLALLSNEEFGNTVSVDYENEFGTQTKTVTTTAGDLFRRNIEFKQIKRDYDTTTIENPISGFFNPSDAFKLLDTEKNHYLRFGALLRYIRDKILIKIDAGKSGNENPPIFDIDVDEWRTHMYSLPNQISLDPRVCIVKNLKFESKGGTVEVFKYLDIFKEVDNGKSTNDNAAYPLNIYLNFEFIKECLKADEKGNVSVYELISNICTGLNKALGGINNLEPIIDEEKNILRIIDTTPIPEYTAKGGGSYKLQIYGYDKTGNDYISNFVRKVDLKTTITPEFATMITVGATAGGYIKGTEATAFSKWNTGLTDRFKEKFIPANSTTATAEENKDEPALVYDEEFITFGYSTRYGFTGFYKNFKLSDNLIEKNISIVTEYYKWLIAKNSEGKDVSGGTVGFIPFKLGLTLDGISGIKIYNVLRVNTEFLPKAYGKTVDLIVTGVSHRLNNNDWETSVEATVMPKTGAASTVAITAEEAKETLNNATGGKKMGGQTKRAIEKYGTPPQEGGKIPLVTFWTSYPLFYSGTQVKNLQNAKQKSTKKSIKVKLSDLTWDKTNKHWKDPNGVYGTATDTYTTPVDKLIVIFKVHKDEKASIEKCYIDIKKEYGLEKIYELGLNCSSGTYVARNVRNGSSYSMHSWGIAIDILAGLNPNNTSKTASFRKPEAKKFLDIMEANGWYSGGRAWDRDYMHFQTIKP